MTGAACARPQAPFCESSNVQASFAHLCGAGRAGRVGRTSPVRGSPRGRGGHPSGTRGGRGPPLRQRHRQRRRGVAGHHPRRAAEKPPRAAPGRGAGVRARPHRHAALWRRQGQPVFPARLQPRPWHRLRDQRQRPAGQHALAWPWPGLFGPELPDPRTGRPHRIPQGPVLCEERQLRRRRLGRHRLPHGAGRELCCADAGPTPVQALRRRRLGSAGRHAPAGRRRGAAQRRPVDDARTPAQEQRRADAVGRHAGAGLERQPDGL